MHPIGAQPGVESYDASDVFGHLLWTLHREYPKDTQSQERKKGGNIWKANPTQKSCSKMFRLTQIR